MEVNDAFQPPLGIGDEQIKVVLKGERGRETIDLLNKCGNGDYGREQCDQLVAASDYPHRIQLEAPKVPHQLQDALAVRPGRRAGQALANKGQTAGVNGRDGASGRHDGPPS